MRISADKSATTGPSLEGQGVTLKRQKIKKNHCLHISNNEAQVL